MTTKHYRLIVDVDVTIHDLNLEVVRERWEQRARERAEASEDPAFLQEEEELPTEQDLIPLQRMLEQLLKNPAHLDRWLRREIIMEVDEGGLEHYRIPMEEEEELRPLVNDLPPRERHWWRELLARDSEWYMKVEELYASFEPKITEVSVFELNSPPNGTA
jgi:hypothetical protein